MQVKTKVWILYFIMRPIISVNCTSYAALNLIFHRAARVQALYKCVSAMTRLDSDKRSPFVKHNLKIIPYR